MSSESKFIPITLPDGIRRDTTSYGAEGHWYSMDKVRFKSGQPQTLGGWQSYTPRTFDGVGRYIRNWTTLDTLHTYVALGTHSKMYIWEGGTPTDITPVSASVSVSNALGITSGETSVVVSVPTHGREVGDYVYLTAGATIGGTNLISGSYYISSVIDANTFVVQTSTTATGTSTAAGGTLTGYFPIHSGYQSNNVAYGWGRGSYSSGAWSVAVSSGLIRRLRKWSGDNWGEDLIFNYKNGPIFYWDATTPTAPGVVIATAPSQNDHVIVTNLSRRVMSFGTIDAATAAFDPMLIRWTDSEDYTDWTPSGVNSAGDIRLQQGSKILGVQETKIETLVWTDTTLYSIKEVDAPYYYAVDVLGLNCGLMSQTASYDIGGVTIWMSHKGFFKYDGQVTPLSFPITQDVFEDNGEFQIDLAQKDKVFCGHNSLYKELIWFYQGVDSTTDDCNRYVIYNYDSNTFYYGTLDRSCWLDAGIFSNPIGVGTDNSMYTHELGLTADGEILESYLESAMFDIADGEELLFTDRLIPDFHLTGALGVTLSFQKYPGGETITKGPYTVVSGTEKVDFRGRGRQMSIRVGTSTLGSSWQLGKMRLRVKTNGRN